MPNKPTTKSNLLTVILNICFKNLTHRLHQNLYLLILLTMNLPIARFSHFFSEKIQRIKQNLVHSDELDFSPFDSDQCDSSFSDFSLISEETVHDIIMKSPSSTCSLDPIPTWLLKKCVIELLPIITKIVNLSFINAKFPRCS